MSKHVEASISRLYRTTVENLLHPTAGEINVNGAAFHITKNGDAICVTDPIIRRTITYDEDLCEEGSESDGDIDPFFDTVAYEEGIEYHKEVEIDTLVEFQGDMAPAPETTIEVAAPPVEAEEPLSSEKVKNRKWQI